jgi:hypothetical protein
MCCWSANLSYPKYFLQAMQWKCKSRSILLLNERVHPTHSMAMALLVSRCSNWLLWMKILVCGWKLLLKCLACICLLRLPKPPITFVQCWHACSISREHGMWWRKKLTIWTSHIIYHSFITLLCDYITFYHTFSMIEIFT